MYFLSLPFLALLISISYQLGWFLKCSIYARIYTTTVIHTSTNTGITDWSYLHLPIRESPTLKSLHTPSTSHSQIEFTLITILTYICHPLIMCRKSRIFFVNTLINRWKGPFIFVFYSDQWDPPLLEAMNVTSPLSDRMQVVQIDYIRDENGELIFPINRLRNIGIQHVRTSHYAVIDMDLWPSGSRIHM